MVVFNLKVRQFILLFVLCLVIIPLELFAQINQDSIIIRKNYNKIEKMIPMRDGIKLFTSIYIPKSEKRKYPFLMVRTPYSCSPYGEDNFRTGFSNMELAKEGYIFVFQDVRGKFMSEGEFVDVRPYNKNKKANEIDEASDTYDTVDWLTKNIKNNNGNVGVFGVSYPGFYSTMAIIDAHPAIKAVSPQAPVTDWWEGDDFHHLGGFMLMDAFQFYSGFGLPRRKPTKNWMNSGYKFNSSDAYDFFLNLGPIKNAKEKYFGDSLAFWNDLMKHPNYDEFWKARNPRPHIKNIKPAVLTVGGLFDAEDCFGAWNLYKAIEKQNIGKDNRIVMGPWVHGGWNRDMGDHLGEINFEKQTSPWYRKEIEAPFFNYYLKGIGNKPGDEATIFFTGKNDWKVFDQWPPKNISSSDIMLLPDGKLSFAQEDNYKISNDEFRSYISDPSKPVPYTNLISWRYNKNYMIEDQRFASRRPDVLVYSSDVFSENTSYAGPIEADIWVSTSGTDMDLIVKLIDVFPNDFKQNPYSKNTMQGHQMLIRAEVIRGKYRDDFSNPKPFTPGEPTRIKFSLPDVAHTFLKGHKMMVQIQSSWFPLVDRNPQTFVDINQCDEKDFQKAEIKIYSTAKYPSKLILQKLKD
jgi:uncharacterized protein